MCKTIVSKTLLILGVLTLAAVPLFGQWHSDTRISNTSSSSYTSYYNGGWNVAADDADVGIVWRDYSYPCVRHVEFPIGSPPAAGPGDEVEYYIAYHPVIATHGIHDVNWDYSVSAYQQIMRFKHKNGSWPGSYEEHGPPGSYWSAIATDDAGNVHCVSRGSFSPPRYEARSYYQQRTGGSWGPYYLIYAPGIARTCYSQSIALESDGTRHVSWGQNWNFCVGYAYSTNAAGSNWNTYDLFATYPMYPFPTSICCNDDGDVYISYRNYNDYQIYVIANEGGSWGSPVNVSNSTGKCHFSSICCDTAGNVWVAWEDRRGSTYEIWYNKLDAETGTWDGDAPITSDDDQYSSYPKISADKIGGVHIVWTDGRDGNYEIYYNWYTGSVGGGRDLACTRIIKPLGKITTDPVKPQAVIANFGGGEDSCFAKCVITGPGGHYDKGNLGGIVYLDAGEENDVNFPSWTPPGGNAGDRYRVEVTVYLWPEKTTEDDDPLNNTRVEYCYIVAGAEVSPVFVIEPEQGAMINSMNPEAWFKNVGTEEAADFICHCDIGPMGFETPEYESSREISETLAPGDSILVEFDLWTSTQEELTPYMAEFYATEVASTPMFVEFMSVVGIEETPLGALHFELAGPNPFRSGTLVSYAMPYPTETTIRVYDVTGKAVRRLHSGVLDGSGSLYWDGTDDAGAKLAGGLYFVRITAPCFTKTAKVVLLH